MEVYYGSPPSDLISTPKCSGTLVTSKHIITSAWCVSSDPDPVFPGPIIFVPSYYVHIGDTVIGYENDVSYSKTTKIKEVILHPEFIWPDTNNIAILEMEEPIALNQYGNIKPACLPIKGMDIITGSTATVIGWGHGDNVFFTQYSSWLHEADITILADEECDNVTTDKLCAGVKQGNEGPCVGDTGGPLVVADPANSNKLTLTGIIDAGIIHFEGYDIDYYNNCTLVQRYTKVSVFIDWINSIIVDGMTCPPS